MNGDFNTPNFDWEHGLPLPDCYYYYSKLRGDAVYTSLCLLGLTQRIGTVHNKNLLDLIFTNFDILEVTFVDMGMVKADIFRRPMVIDTDLMFYKSVCNYELFFYHKYAAGVYRMLYNVLLSDDWSQLCNNISLDDAVNSPNTAKPFAMDQ